MIIITPIHLSANSRLSPHKYMAAPLPPISRSHLIVFLTVLITSAHCFKCQLIPSHDEEGCSGIQNYHSDSAAKCAYARTHTSCNSIGYIPYLQLFYCHFATNPSLGYAFFLIFVILLFYLLGTTTANYFCASLEGTSRLLNLSPSVAGVTLLSLGNGAPDLFSGIVSFAGDAETIRVGLNSILGGAFFISSVVVGVIAISGGRDGKSVSRPSFFRDVFFLVLSLACLALIIYLGEISLYGTLCFFSLYLVYASVVSTMQFCSSSSNIKSITDEGDDELVLPASARCKWDELEGGWHEFETPLLIPHFQTIGKVVQVNEEGENKSISAWLAMISSKCLCIFELPRRLTIPVVSDEQWSKPFLVLSSTISPPLLAFLAVSYLSESPNASIYYAIGCLSGLILGFLSFLTTETLNPPRKGLLPWLFGGFVMSIVWTYVLARELVSLLVSVGMISGISASVLGLIVLAWGNSLGDLVANVSMAVKGGARGTQVAISGCYAGPLFNIVVGLGVSLMISCWRTYPERFVLPKDPYVFETMGFLGGGLVYAMVMVVLSRRKEDDDLKLDMYLGWGLLSIYLSFLFLRVARASGLLHQTTVF